MSEFGIQAFQQIALNEQESKEGKITQEIVESLKNDNKNDFFTALAKKVGNRGVQVNFKDKKEQLLKLASAISKSPEVDAEFESLEPAKNEVEANQQACKLMTYIGRKCNSVMKLPEFDAVRDWVEMDYATSRYLYG